MTGDSRRGRPWRPSDPPISADPYATLGLPPDAPMAEVKRAYRRLAKAFHPDSAGSDALPRFLAIHEAYERIATGRVLPGTARRDAATRPEPWRADPARARATRARAPGAGAATSGSGGTGRRSTGRSSAEGGADSRGPGGSADGRQARDRSGRRHATRKATLGSTSYDEARDRTDAAWSGASWYGPTTGEYWIINPREYADPRKHGPAYQARVRQRAAEEAARAEAAAGAAPAPGVEAAEPRAEDPAGPPDAGRRRPTPSGAGPRPAARAPGRPPETGEAVPSGVTMDALTDPDTAPPWARWPLLGGAADDPIRRLRLALVAWPPLGVAAAIATADVTGCAVYAATCTGVAPLLPWLAQVVILALLMLLPPLARLLGVGTVAVLIALVPTTAVLLVLGAGGRPQAGFALAVLLALAWLGGVTFAAASAARRGSVSSQP